jgi:hypothetical protein
MESSEDITYDLDLLKQSEAAWRRSAGLRLMYGRLYRAVRERCPEGPVLEIGSGIAAGREFFDGLELVTSDVARTPYVDRAMSAYAVEPPEGGGGWAAVFAIDVLHHLRFPFRFFESAAAALRPGGRIILVEPAATPFGRLFYTLCHHEPIRPAEIRPPFEFEPNGPDGEFANMGMGVGLFRRNREEVGRRLEALGLRCTELSFRDVLAYPLTGGYSKPQVMPTGVLRWLLGFEKLMPQSVLRLLGLRAVIVIEKSGAAL